LWTLAQQPSRKLTPAVSPTRGCDGEIQDIDPSKVVLPNFSDGRFRITPAGASDDQLAEQLRSSQKTNLVVWEYRRQHVSVYAGRQDHALALSGGRLLIRFKIIHLIKPAEPQGNITFII
jgi:hypothetical protein